MWEDRRIAETQESCISSQVVLVRERQKDRDQTKERSPKLNPRSPPRSPKHIATRYDGKSKTERLGRRGRGKDGASEPCWAASTPMFCGPGWPACLSKANHTHFSLRLPASKCWGAESADAINLTESEGGHPPCAPSREERERAYEGARQERERKLPNIWQGEGGGGPSPKIRQAAEAEHPGVHSRRGSARPNPRGPSAGGLLLPSQRSEPRSRSCCRGGIT